MSIADDAKHAIGLTHQRLRCPLLRAGSCSNGIARTLATDMPGHRPDKAVAACLRVMQPPKLSVSSVVEADFDEVYDAHLVQGRRQARHQQGHDHSYLPTHISMCGCVVHINQRDGACVRECVHACPRMCERVQEEDEGRED